MSESDPASRRGSRPARHSASSAARLPTPASRDWSMSRALRGAVDAPSARRSCPRVTVRASGPRRDSRGSNVTPPRRRESRIRRSPPSAKRTAKRSHFSSSSFEAHHRSVMAARPSTSRRPAIPKCKPSTGPPSLVSRSSCLPMRRAPVNDRPCSAAFTARALRPPFRYQSSGA